MLQSAKGVVFVHCSLPNFTIYCLVQAESNNLRYYMPESFMQIGGWVGSKPGGKGWNVVSTSV